MLILVIDGCGIYHEIALRLMSLDLNDDVLTWWVQVSRKKIQALFKDFFKDFSAIFKDIFSVVLGVSQ